MSDIRIVKRIIDEHLTEIHTNKDLERFTNYSVEQIRKDFVRSEHVTLAAFIRLTRVAMAKQLLLKPDLTCKSICYMVGFSNEEVGEKVVKRLTGMTMVTHRKSGRIEAAKD